MTGAGCSDGASELDATMGSGGPLLRGSPHHRDRADEDDRRRGYGGPAGGETLARSIDTAEAVARAVLTWMSSISSRTIRSTTMVRFDNYTKLASSDLCCPFSRSGLRASRHGLTYTTPRDGAQGSTGVGYGLNFSCGVIFSATCRRRHGRPAMVRCGCWPPRSRGAALRRRSRDKFGVVRMLRRRGEPTIGEHAAVGIGDNQFVACQLDVVVDKLIGCGGERQGAVVLQSVYSGVPIDEALGWYPGCPGRCQRRTSGCPGTCRRTRARAIWPTHRPAT
jgi:hypothetical protein